MRSWWRVSNYFPTVLSARFCKSPTLLRCCGNYNDPVPLGRWERGSSYPARDLLKATGTKLRWIRNYRLLPLLRAFLIAPFINTSFRASWKHKIHTTATSQINKRTEISAARDAFVYVYLYTLPKQVCGHLRVPFTQIQLLEWHTCRSFRWKKDLTHDRQENMEIRLCHNELVLYARVKSRAFYVCCWEHASAKPGRKRSPWDHTYQSGP